MPAFFVGDFLSLEYDVDLRNSWSVGRRRSYVV
jgi:hypothetical protein